MMKSPNAKVTPSTAKADLDTHPVVAGLDVLAPCPTSKVLETKASKAGPCKSDTVVLEWGVLGVEVALGGAEGSSI